MTNWMAGLREKAKEAQQGNTPYLKWEDYEGAVVIFYLPDSELKEEYNGGHMYINIHTKKLKVYGEDGGLKAHYDFYNAPDDGAETIRIPCNANMRCRIENRVEAAVRQVQGKEAIFVPAPDSVPVEDAVVCVMYGYERVADYTAKGGGKRKGFHKMMTEFHREDSEPYNDLWTDAPIKLIERE